MASIESKTYDKMYISLSKVFTPKKANIVATLIIFAISIELTSSWKLIISNIMNPSTQGFSAGFPLNVVEKLAGFCPSAAPNSEPVECVTPKVKLQPAGLIFNLTLFYTIASIGLQKCKRCSKWL